MRFKTCDNEYVRPDGISTEPEPCRCRMTPTYKGIDRTGNKGKPIWHCPACGTIRPRKVRK